MVKLEKKHECTFMMEKNYSKILLSGRTKRACVSNIFKVSVLFYTSHVPDILVPTTTTSHRSIDRVFWQIKRSFDVEFDTVRIST
jgi:hypothetical protein